MIYREVSEALTCGRESFAETMPALPPDVATGINRECFALGISDTPRP